MAQKLDPTLLHAITPPVFDKKKLQRKHLIDKLHANLERKLQVIAAPAGYGKTTLLAEFAADSEIPACWVRLDEESDLDVQQVAILIVSSLRKRFRRLAKAIDPRISAEATPESAARILAEWIESNLDESFALLIDEAHVLNTRQQLLAFSDELLALRPSGFTMILAGREVPELALAKLMAEGELAGLGPHDLSFSKDEVQQLATLMTGAPITESDATRLVQATRGWVTGVLLTGILARHTMGQAGAAGGSLVYEYLASVILNRLPDDMRRFALEASVLPFMTADGCDEVMQRKDSARLLALFVKMGVFIEVTEGEPRAYEFHPLFRDFLRETLAGSNPTRVHALMIRAAGYMEQHGSADAAFQLYLDAKAPRHALRLAEGSSSQLLERGRTETMKGWWRGLSQSGQRPVKLGIALTTALVDQGSVSEAEGVLSSMQGSRSIIPPRVRVRMENLRAEIALQRGQLSRCVEIVDRASGQLARAHDSRTRATSNRLRAVALARLDRDPENARRSARSALVDATRTGDKTMIARALLTMSYVLDVTGDHRGANGAAEQAHDLLRNVGTPIQLAASYNNLGDARHKEGRYEEAMKLYGEGLKYARQGASPLREANVLFGQADLFNDVGMPRQAAELYGEGLSIATRLENPTLLHFGCVRTSAMYRRRGSLAIANEWMKRGIEFSSGRQHPISTRIQIAALELSAAPAKAAESLNALLSSRMLNLTGEDLVLTNLFLAKSALRLGSAMDFDEFSSRALTAAGVHGAEQALASELGFDTEFLEKLRVSRVKSPVLAVVLGRLEEMRTFRALHSEEAAEVRSKTHIDIRGFGPGEIRVGGELVTTLKPQPKEVFFYLADRKAVGKDELAERFWPTHSSGRRAANIHTSVHAIRRAVGKDVVSLGDGVYSIAADADLDYDVDKFEKAASIAERLPSGDPRRLFALTEAINNYGGPFLSDTDNLWVESRRRTLELRYLDLVASLSVEALTRDQPERALEVLRRALTIDPLRDDINYRLMEALGRLGRVREVIAHYQKYSRDLRQELGIDPPTPIRELYDRLIG